MRKGRAGQVEITILPQFLAIEPHFVRKGCAGQVEIAISPQFLTIEPHFARKGSPETRTRNFTSVFDDRTSFRAKGLRQTTCNSQFYLSFWRSNLISCERVHRKHELAILPQFLTIEPHFVRKGCARRLATRNFTSVFGDRTSFRAKGLRGTS